MDPDEEQLEHAVILLNERLLGTVLGFLSGAGLFLLTNILVLKGGRRVGVHLGLLGNFFPGYRVTFMGSIIGFCYMFVVGLIVGVVLGSVYNKIAKA